MPASEANHSLCAKTNDRSFCFLLFLSGPPLYMFIIKTKIAHLHSTSHMCIHFLYCLQHPFLKDFSPKVGPLAGGTIVNVSVGYFKNRNVFRIKVASTGATKVTRFVFCVYPSLQNHSYHHKQYTGQA